MSLFALNDSGDQRFKLWLDDLFCQNYYTEHEVLAKNELTEEEIFNCSMLIFETSCGFCWTTEAVLNGKLYKTWSLMHPELIQCIVNANKKVQVLVDDKPMNTSILAKNPGNS